MSKAAAGKRGFLEFDAPKGANDGPRSEHYRPWIQNLNRGRTALLNKTRSAPASGGIAPKNVEHLPPTRAHANYRDRSTDRCPVYKKGGLRPLRGLGLPARMRRSFLQGTERRSER